MNFSVNRLLIILHLTVTKPRTISESIDVSLSPCPVAVITRTYFVNNGKLINRKKESRSTAIIRYSLNRSSSPWYSYLSGTTDTYHNNIVIVCTVIGGYETLGEIVLADRVVGAYAIHRSNALLSHTASTYRFNNPIFSCR
jgi:hypothetical protein